MNGVKGSSWTGTLSRCPVKLARESSGISWIHLDNWMSLNDFTLPRHWNGGPKRGIIPKWPYFRLCKNVYTHDSWYTHIYICSPEFWIYITLFDIICIAYNITSHCEGLTARSPCKSVGTGSAEPLNPWSCRSPRRSMVQHHPEMQINIPSTDNII